MVEQPVDLKGKMSEVETDILKFIEEFQREFPNIKIERFDERFTLQKITLVLSAKVGKIKNNDKKKGLMNKLSATYFTTIFRE